MKLQIAKKLFAFTITVMMFSIVTESASAQKKCNQHCPKGYTCVNGYCELTGYFCQCGIRGYGCTSAACSQYCAGACGSWFSNTSPTENSSKANSQSTTINFQLNDAGNVTIKIYDVTGRLVKKFADDNMQQGVHQIEWDQKDENGNLVTTGIYILQFDSDNKSETKKLSVIK